MTIRGEWMTNQESSESSTHSKPVTSHNQLVLEHSLKIMKDTTPPWIWQTMTGPDNLPLLKWAFTYGTMHRKLTGQYIKHKHNNTKDIITSSTISILYHTGGDNSMNHVCADKQKDWYPLSFFFFFGFCFLSLSSTPFCIPCKIRGNGYTSGLTACPSGLSTSFKKTSGSWSQAGTSAFVGNTLLSPPTSVPCLANNVFTSSTLSNSLLPVTSTLALGTAVLMSDSNPVALKSEFLMRSKHSSRGM